MAFTLCLVLLIDTQSASLCGSHETPEHGLQNAVIISFYMLYVTGEQTSKASALPVNTVVICNHSSTHTVQHVLC